MRPLAALFALLLLAFPSAAQKFEETITVERILFDIRVTESRGEPITALTADDFKVRIGGKDAKVESVVWVSDKKTTPRAETPPDNSTTRQPDNSPGRLFVVFIQTDYSRHPTRVVGQMKFLQHAEKMMESLAPDDRVAVFSFDSHLKFRLDFTGDKEAVVGAIEDALFIDHPGPPPAGDPSLAPRLDRAAMKRAATSEAGLRIVGAALRGLPGPKSLVLMGWGLGEMTRAGVRMRPEWRLARRELEAARTSVFSLDTTYADYHTLEAGLMLAAESTGGFYAKTHIFPSIAIERLQKTLSGHYEIELRRPEGLRPGTHELMVRVERRGAYVLAPSSWMDRP